MAADSLPESPDTQADGEVKKRIDAILTGIRVPDLPYPVGRVEPDQQPDWRPLLLSCWKEQRDESVTHLLKSVSLTWTVTQVNAAYIADRIMDIFLRTSGLHPVLVQRVARLRFLLAWRMGEGGASAFEDSIRDWIDSLADLRGWSDSGGRSSRALLDQLDNLVIVVSRSFETQSLEPFGQFASDWHREAAQRQERSVRLHERLLETEQGAASQRQAEQVARATVGRTLKGRELPELVISFVTQTWLPLLRQVAWASGTDSNDWRHASKLLEWLVWVGDPGLSDRDRDRLYQVGEQLGDKLNDVWSRVQGKTMPADSLQGIESVLVARLRGEMPDMQPAISPERPFPFDGRWLASTRVDPDKLQTYRGHWFVEGEGNKEQRRYLLDLLEHSGEVLWTNGFGVKLGLSSWLGVVESIEQGQLKLLPDLNRFASVLADTVEALARVLLAQRRQRQKAAAEAKAKADALRADKEAADLRRREEEAAALAEQKRLKAEADARRMEDEAAARERLEKARFAEALVQVDGIKAGGWIAIERREDQPTTQSDGTSAGAQRLKLAIRINASRKLVFVDRLGLNRTEFIVEDLATLVAAGGARVLNQAAEFDDTLSRVVGRIRVGKGQG
ncbi:DUF1631 family protein [Marinobacter sp.]|uniref:DUF1631 family protein n=1 Tax=Marinobacter sp. TaxID=50741 RepID=UPI0038504116